MSPNRDLKIPQNSLSLTERIKSNNYGKRSVEFDGRLTAPLVLWSFRRPKLHVHSPIFYRVQRFDNFFFTVTYRNLIGIDLERKRYGSWDSLEIP